MNGNFSLSLNQPYISRSISGAATVFYVPLAYYRPHLF